MKPVLIIENQRNSLKVNENATTKQDYRLSGPFTDFDVVNRNNRIYTATEFVPHLERMMEKKKWGVIYGEMDHPENFDISLKAISHTIENAFYNESLNRVEGEIRLLNTHHGKDAKALVDDGLPLFVSSRAAGVTESNGKVKLNQLFTYDLVADPGFSSARMQVKNINESLGFRNDGNFMIIESTKHDLSNLAAKFDQSSHINIFDLSDDSKTNDLFNMNKNDMVTKKQLSEWSQHLIAQIKENDSKIISKITESKGSKKYDKELETLLEYKENMISQFEIVQKNIDSQFKKYEKYFDYLAEKVEFSIKSTEVLETKTEKLVEFSNYIVEELDKTIDFSNYLSENLNNSIEYSNYLYEGLDKAIDYTNYLAESLDKTIDYSQYIAENLTNTIKYSNYLAEGIDKNIDYTQYIAENLDNNIGYTQYIAENLDSNIGYTQYIAENLDTNIGYANYIGENLDANIGFSQYIAENLEATIEYADYISECVDTSMDYSNSIAESINSVNKNGSLITEKIKISTADEYLTIIKYNKKDKEEEEKEAKQEAKNSKKIKELKFKKFAKNNEEEEEENINTKKKNKEVSSDEEESETEKFIKENSKVSLTDKISQLIEEAKKREASKVVRPNFYEFITADDIKSFESLKNDEQESVKIAMNESTGYYSRHDVLSIMKQVLDKGKPSAEETLIVNMPTEIKSLWEKVDMKTKKSILAQAKFYDTSSAILAEHFWNTRKLGSSINESKVLVNSANPFENINKLSDEQVEFFSNKFKNL